MWRWSNAATILIVVAQQHAVAEHVARHVAAPDDADRLRLDVGPALGEVPLDADPRALGGDPHRLVVVPDRAAARERIAQPEAVLERNGIGDVGEGRGALVGGDDEIGVLTVMDRRRPGGCTTAPSTMLSVIDSSVRMNTR